jgi:hypothetical protein
LAVATITTSDAVADPVGPQLRLSQVGYDGDASRGAYNPASAYDPTTGRHLVVWQADDAADEKYEVFGRMAGADGLPAGGQFRIGTAGGAGDATRTAGNPRVAYNTSRREFFVVWSADQSTVDGDVEVWGQRVSADGNLIGGSVRISTMGAGDATYNGDMAQVAYNPRRDQYLVVWHGLHSSVPGHGNEVWGHLISGAGQLIGIDDTRITSSTNYAIYPTVAYNPVNDEYMVAFIGNNDGTQKATVQRLTGDAAPIGINTRIQTAGESHKPAIAFDPQHGRYLVAWPYVAANDTEIHAQLLSGTGAEIGADDLPVSAMGPVGAPDYHVGADVGVGYSTGSQQWLVAWPGDDSVNGLVKGEWEVFGQSLTADGAPLGSDDVPISSMGPDGTADFGAVPREILTGPIDYDAVHDRFLTVWSGDDDTAPLANDEIEVFGRLVAPVPVTGPRDEPKHPKEPPLPPVAHPCPAVLVAVSDTDGDGCSNAMPITREFQVAFVARRNRVTGLVLTGVASRATVTILCRSGCRFTGKKRRVIARAKAGKKGGQVRITFKKVKIKPGARLEARVAGPSAVGRYAEFRVSRHLPYARRIAQGCMHPKYGTKLRC